MKVDSERTVAKLWRSGRFSSFEDDTGNGIEVVYPGRESTRAGCDFQDVVIQVNGEKAVGDVEVHLMSDGWQKHGHHRDPAYNGIMLHVAMWQRGRLPVSLQDGRSIPTVILHRYIPAEALRSFRPGSRVKPCRNRRRYLREGVLKDVLLEAGRQRFEQKAAKYAGMLGQEEPTQVLYQGICRALGYSRNMGPFEELSSRLRLSFLYENAKGLHNKMGLLMGAAGLLQSQRSPDFPLDDEASAMEEAWRCLGAAIPSPVVSGWRMAYIRPPNHPVRRLAGLGYLLQRYECAGLLNGLLSKICEAEQKPSVLDVALMIEEVPYWSGHFDFGRRQSRPSALLGKSRAAEIAVNAVLPFAAAYARQMKDRALESRAIHLFNEYHALQRNELTGYMAEALCLDDGKGFSACLQQGLLHIYHGWCRVKDCRACPLS